MKKIAIEQYATKILAIHDWNYGEFLSVLVMNAMNALGSSNDKSCAHYLIWPLDITFNEAFQMCARIIMGNSLYPNVSSSKTLDHSKPRTILYYDV